MVEFVAYKDVQCVFPISGQYGAAPRGLFYALVVFVVVFKRQDWLTIAAAAAAFTFGGSTAIHSVILSCAEFIFDNGGSSTEGVLLANGTIVEVTVEAVDMDSDATLAIMGVGFLIVLPLARWQIGMKTNYAMHICFIWSLLMFSGIVAGATSLVRRNNEGQFRFCSPGYNETSPLSSNAIEIAGGSWNTTIWTYFGKLNASQSGCYYPCLEANNVLRQHGDATALEFSNSNWQIWTGVAIFFYIMLSTPPNIVLWVYVRKRKDHDHRWISVYSTILLSVVLPGLILWIEWIIHDDLQSESIQMIGQWAPLVGAALALISAAIGRYWSSARRLLVGFSQRRDFVRSKALEESRWSSWKDVRDYDTSTAWYELGIVNFRMAEESWSEKMGRKLPRFVQTAFRAQ